MNFLKYEQEVSSFLTENYTNLKRAKVANSEVALKEFLLTEQADINNYVSSIIKKIVSDARKSFAAETDLEKGYELADKYKHLIKIPHLEKININYSRSESNDINLMHSMNIQEQDKNQTLKNFKDKSPFLNHKAFPIAVGAGAATTLVGLPSMMLLKPASIVTSLTVVGLSAVIVAGLVYVFISYMDETGKEQQAYVQPKQTVSAPKPSTDTVKRTIDQVSMGQLLDLRKSEAEQLLIKTIQDAKMKYEKMQLQII
jgi:hypothetical protein